MISFIQDNSLFLPQNHIQLFIIIQYMSDEQQVEFTKLMDNSTITLNDKLKALVCLSDSIKLQIDHCVGSKISYSPDFDRFQNPSIAILSGNLLYVAEPGTGTFVRLSRDKFLAEFDFYEQDKENKKDSLPWDIEFNTTQQTLNEIPELKVAVEEIGEEQL